jgi:[CysO sulfur-carrier protein]-S-L-cysteine hydrolase
MTLQLPQAMIDEMVQHATEDYPFECCGVITGEGPKARKLYRTRNSEPEDVRPFRYSIDPRDLLRIEREMDEADQSVLVIYHSHVASDAYPSPTDVRLSQWQGTDPPVELYPGAFYVLVSLKERDNPSVRAFTIKGGEITEEELKAV